MDFQNVGRQLGNSRFDAGALVVVDLWIAQQSLQLRHRVYQLPGSQGHFGMGFERPQLLSGEFSGAGKRTLHGRIVAGAVEYIAQ